MRNNQEIDLDVIAAKIGCVMEAFTRNAHEPHDPLSDSITITKDGYIAGIIRLARLQAWVEGLSEAHKNIKRSVKVDTVA